VAKADRLVTARRSRFVPSALIGFARSAQGHVAAARLPLDRTETAVLPATAFRPLLARLARGQPSVLDVGSGTMATLAQLPCRVRVGVDAHRPYLENRVTDATLVPIHLDADRLEQVFLPRSFALVTLIDVVEHFDVSRAEALLERCERIASRRVVVFTPSGEFPQAEYDFHGLGGEEYQRHRSAWEPEGLRRLGYSVAVLDRFHGPGNPSFDAAFPGGHRPLDALLAWKDVVE
jgi:hypothetical protein